MYEIINDDKDGGILCIMCDTPNCSIPLDPANSDYQRVLDDIIEQGADCFEGDIPADIQTAANNKQFAQQLSEYTVAIARLDNYILADGRAEVTEMQDTLEYVVDAEGMPVLNDDGEMTYVQEEVVVVSAIEPLEATVEQTVYDVEGEATTSTIENPLITTDNAERVAAQAVVDNTPQPVIDKAEE